MADSPRYPIPNPALRFTRDPMPVAVNPRGKSSDSIKRDRIRKQRGVLAEAFLMMAETASGQPSFDDWIVAYAAMFDDSIAPSFTPGDLFNPAHGARLMAPHDGGYLVRIRVDRMRNLAEVAERTTRTKEMADISRIRSIRHFSGTDATRGLTIEELWETAPEMDAGRAYSLWLMPFGDAEAAEDLLRKLVSLRDGALASPQPLLAEFRTQPDSSLPPALRQCMPAVATETDRISTAMREHRHMGRARTMAIVPSKSGLQKLISSGIAFRIDPAVPIAGATLGNGTDVRRHLFSPGNDAVPERQKGGVSLHGALSKFAGLVIASRRERSRRGQSIQKETVGNFRCRLWKQFACRFTTPNSTKLRLATEFGNKCVESLTLASRVNQQYS